MFRYLVVGLDRNGQILERWWLRSHHNVDVARMDMYTDAAIKNVVIVSLCTVCGFHRRRGECTNEACPTRLPQLPVPAAI